MILIILVVVISSVVSAGRPCAYWCESSCTKAVASFYCCSFEPSLQGPKQFLPPPCESLCRNRPGNDPHQLRNCKSETEDLQKAGMYKTCGNFHDCDPKVHDACCPDNCLQESEKMCVKL